MSGWWVLRPCDPLAGFAGFVGRVKLVDLTTPEVVALVAVFEAADLRVNARTAPVLHLATRVGATWDAPGERLTNETT